MSKDHDRHFGLAGFRYLTGKDLEKLNELSTKCSSFLSQRGFQEIITPILEDWALFVGLKDRPVSVYDVGNIFSLITPRGEAAVLRYENTIPVCKYVAAKVKNRELKTPARFFYLAPQYRNERNLSNLGDVRLREFYQVGWEIFDEGFQGIIEAACTGLDLLKRLGLKGTIKLSDVNILGSIFADFAIDSFNQRLFSRIINKEDASRLNQALSSANISEAAKHLLHSLKNLNGKPQEVLKDASIVSRKRKYPKLKNYVADLVEISERVKRQGRTKAVEIDLSIVRSPGFYSGVIFQYYFSTNSLESGGGGEYNQIVKSLGGPKISAVGAAFGLERLIYEYSSKKKS